MTAPRFAELVEAERRNYPGSAINRDQPARVPGVPRPRKHRQVKIVERES